MSSCPRSMRHAARVPDVQQAILHDGEHAESEQVDLHQPGGIEIVLLPLDDGAAGHRRRLDGHDGAERLLGEDKPPTWMERCRGSWCSPSTTSARTLHARVVGIEAGAREEFTARGAIARGGGAIAARLVGLGAVCAGAGRSLSLARGPRCSAASMAILRSAWRSMRCCQVASRSLMSLARTAALARRLSSRGVVSTRSRGARGGFLRGGDLPCVCADHAGLCGGFGAADHEFADPVSIRLVAVGVSVCVSLLVSVSVPSTWSQYCRPLFHPQCLCGGPSH